MTRAKSQKDLAIAPATRLCLSALRYGGRAYAPIFWRDVFAVEPRPERLRVFETTTTFHDNRHHSRHALANNATTEGSFRSSSNWKCMLKTEFNSF
jgi:hypothetical protein